MDDKNNKKSILTNPFVGARPYRVEDANLYQGRDQESIAVAHDIKDSRINVLTGGSACGKTSFIQAKLVPLLCDLRGKHERRMPIPIILTGWGEGLSSREESESGFDFHTMILKKLTSWVQIETGKSVCPDAFKHLDPSRKVLNEDFYKNKFVQNDFRSIQGVFANLNFTEEQGTITDLLSILDNLCLKRDTSILLIFDQLEEVFRSKDEADDSVIEVLNQLYHRRKNYNLLLSLRQEYIYALRPLEMVAGIPINKHIRTLRKIVTSSKSQLNSSNALDIFTEIWKCNGFENIKRKNVDRVLSNCIIRQGSDNIAVQRNANANLLLIQAICGEIWEFIHENSETGEPISRDFSDKTINEFEKKIAGDLDNVKDKVYRSALERWLEKKIHDVNEKKPDIFAKWCTARIARNLVVSDYKVAIPVDRISERLFNDVCSLNLEKNSNIHRITDEEEIRIIPDGISNKEITRIVEKTLEALGEQEVGILKYFANKKVVELVHDQLGPCIERWSEKYQKSWEDCLGSPLVKQGVEIKPFVGKPVKAREPISKVFKGCVFIAIHNRPTSSEPTHGDYVTFDGIAFKKCSLNGSIFFYCNFKDCIFEESDLAGVLFWGCTFGNIIFRNINKDDSQMKFKGCRFNGVSFEGCTIVQTSIYEDIVKGFKSILEEKPIIITDSSFELCLIEEMEPEESATREISEQTIFDIMHDRRKRVFSQCRVGSRIFQAIEKDDLGEHNLPIEIERI